MAPHEAVWNQVIASLVTQWGAIEYWVAMTIQLASPSLPLVKPEKDFARRLTQWRTTVDCLGSDSPHDLEKLKSKIDHLRKARDHIVHGMFGNVTTDGIVTYFVQFANRETRRKAVGSLLKVEKSVRRAMLRDPKALHAWAESLPHHTVTYKLDKMVQMVNEELPKITYQLLEVQIALRKRQRRLRQSS
jgi:hypothetical protein